MSSTIEQTTATLEELLLRRTQEDDAFARLQQRASDDFQRRGFPTTQDEEWRYIPLAPIIRARYAAVDATASRTGRGIALPGCFELEIINGKVARVAEPLPPGLSLTFGREARADLSALSRLGSLAGSDKHPFAALNLALLDELVLIRIATGSRLSKPLLLTFYCSGGEAPVATNVRCLVVAERGAQASIIETYSGNQSYFMNSVTELFAEDGSIVDHYKVECESLGAWHIGNLQARVDRNAVFRSTVVSFGGSIARNELRVTLAGEGAETNLRGLYVLRGSQLVDNHTVIDHAMPHTSSLELYKGILDEKSRGSFDGKIIVQRVAQKTSSKQTNNNLLLSKDAVADSKPQLEIHADDVKCAHGSTIGQLDEEAVFYLRSRGIDEAEARNVLSFAFASDVLSEIRVEPLRRILERQLLDRIPRRKEERA